VGHYRGPVSPRMSPFEHVNRPRKRLSHSRWFRKTLKKRCDGFGDGPAGIVFHAVPSCSTMFQVKKRLTEYLFSIQEQNTRCERGALPTELHAHRDFQSSKRALTRQSSFDDSLRRVPSARNLRRETPLKYPRTVQWIRADTTDSDGPGRNLARR